MQKMSKGAELKALRHDIEYYAKKLNEVTANWVKCERELIILKHDRVPVPTDVSEYERGDLEQAFLILDETCQNLLTEIAVITDAYKRGVPYRFFVKNALAN